MFDMIGVAPICVRADREVQGSICERLTLPDKDFSSDSREGEIGAKSG